MSNFNISTRYSNAFIELAESKNILDSVSEDMELLHNTLTGSRDLRNLLSSPVVKKAVKVEILEKIFAEKIIPDTLTFMKFVVKKNRENILPDIVKRFIELRDDKMGIVNATVTSTVGISDDLKKELHNSIEKFADKTARVNYNLDEELIGGFKIKLGDTVLDASVKNQLNLLKKKFIEENIINN